MQGGKGKLHSKIDYTSSINPSIQKISLKPRFYNHNWEGKWGLIKLLSTDLSLCYWKCVMTFNNIFNPAVLNIHDIYIIDYVVDID